ncbi:S24 family peptidase [Pinibacter soli]|uniref:S24 family peptidase n=1 Tax=Pinibacter soli TaxID=3044211 RepID=A0ABT6R9E2_9BACT|nr:S24 family peptidase [Pinibacter soli]MDI3319162.1 S24 family peptidase [Pinibacter soli]
MSSIIDRIRQIIDSKGISERKFCEEIGVSNGFLGKVKSVGSDNLMKIVDRYPEISPEWLLTGKGEMLKNASATSSNPNIFEVKLVSQYAYAGYLNGYGDAEYLGTLPTVPFVLPDGPTPKGSYLAFEVKGESMNDGTVDSIVEHDLALGRLIQPHLYCDSKLHYKRWNSFVIVTKNDGIVIKQIINHDVENKTITIHSLNPEYEDNTIHLTDVAQIFNVVQLLRKTK